MMSPLSVAQLIERGTMYFDVVVFDEASQVRPEDSLSALARSRQFVVVGDQMQLPPTSFGERTYVEDPIDDEDTGEVEESAAVESILELASAAYGDGRTLLWHYRSRDPSLIAFSNKEFYQNRLLLFPCPRAKNHSSGVKYVWVGGKYSARTNIEEARICAKAAVEFIRHDPNKSLGIVALNRPQADLIQLELDRLIHDYGTAAAYRAKWEASLEPLFVKNLENVQGDERDVIFVSTVFGEDEAGRFFQRFGPINSKVGHRRLNVLFTRAKHQLVVFTSLPTEKIQVSENAHWGVRALKEYLEYARTGTLERGAISGRSEDSPFEVGVRAAIESKGFKCEPQIGVAGFFIDLGVRHPKYPDCFLAGIECDGAAYHSTPTARDRDRLRQFVLESFGWNIYRIWSTDWFTDPHAQLEKLIAHLNQLRASPQKAYETVGFDFASRFGRERQMVIVESNGAAPEKGATEAQ
jgi:very-short-patch-repair endonuclease